MLAAVVLVVCVASGRLRSRLLQLGSRQQLGMYDTPPVTWFYPANSQENTLGYTWDQAAMQRTSVTYEPGMMTVDDSGEPSIARTTEDTVGFLTGPTTTAYPLGSAIEYQSQEETYPGLATRQLPQLAASWGAETGHAALGTPQAFEARRGGGLGDEVMDLPTDGLNPVAQGEAHDVLHDDGDMHVPADLLDSYTFFKPRRPLHATTLHFMHARNAAARGSPANLQSLADHAALVDMERTLLDAKDSAAKPKSEGAISAKEDLLTKKLDAAFAKIKLGAGRGASRKGQGAALVDVDKEMEDMRLSDDLIGAAEKAAVPHGRGGARVPRGGRPAARARRKSVRQGVAQRRLKGQSLSYSVDPLSTFDSIGNSDALGRYGPLTSDSVGVNGVKVHAQYATDNIAGPGIINVAKPTDDSGPKWQSSNDVQLQSSAVMVDPGEFYPTYSFHVPGEFDPGVKGEKWSYSDFATDVSGKKNGPSYWGGRCRSGQNQSPINLELNIHRDDALKMLRWVGPTEYYQATLISPLYKNVLTLEGLQGSLMVSDVKMELQSATIHTPSEHKLEGRRLPGEIQFLHQGPGNAKAIVSVFLEIGAATAPCLQTIMAGVREYLGTYSGDVGYTAAYAPPGIGQDVKPPVWMNTASLAEDVLGTGSNYANYFTYYGSLSRPPCDEGVTWIILKTPLLISGTDHSDLLYEQGFTARPTQATNDREVYDTATGHHGSAGFQSPDIHGW